MSDIVTNPFDAIMDKLLSIEKEVNEIKKSIDKQPLKKYSPQEIAENTPLGIQTVRASIKDGRIKAEKFGRKYLISKDEFERVCKEAKSLKYQRKDNRKTRYVFHNLETGNKINTKGIDDPKNIVDEMTVLKHLNSGESFVKDGEKYIVYTE